MSFKPDVSRKFIWWNCIKVAGLPIFFWGIHNTVNPRGKRNLLQFISYISSLVSNLYLKVLFVARLSHKKSILNMVIQKKINC
jgi:hypothetical protein